jgi:hypothetical protein
MQLPGPMMGFTSFNPSYALRRCVYPGLVAISERKAKAASMSNQKSRIVSWRHPNQSHISPTNVRVTPAFTRSTNESINTKQAILRLIVLEKERLERVRRGEAWGPDQPGPHSALGRDRAIIRIKNRIAELEKELIDDE